MLSAIAATGAGFLTAVLWFDLMFDVQVRKHAGDILPDDVLASIRTYYRRVTTDATPMNRLISVAMLTTLAAIGLEIVRGAAPLWFSLPSFAAALSAIGLAAVRTVGNAVRLGGAADAVTIQTQLARAIYRDHVYCLTAMTTVVVLQLGAS
jgi:hypothetical protein